LNFVKGSKTEPPTKQNSAEEADWVRELPDELDVCIAQRDFDAAVDLLFEGTYTIKILLSITREIFCLGRDYLNECSDAALVQEVKEKLDLKQDQLTDKLCKELKILSDKYLQGGPKSTRKAVMLLVRLGKASQACDLYLKNRAATMKHAIRELKEDKWRQYNLQSESNMHRFVQEMKDIGISIEDMVCERSLRGPNATEDRCWLWLTGQVCHFVRCIMPFVYDIAYLRVKNFIPFCDESFTNVWKTELEYLERSGTTVDQ
uniref:FHA domain-containing protein n=1 Tax=Soboliphyme baturini TaxID=241478 RepID=A0A183J8C3_9BILA